MANYNIAGDTLVQGINCEVRAGNSAADAKKIGLVSEASFRKQIQTQRAEVIGEIYRLTRRAFRCRFLSGVSFPKRA